MTWIGEEIILENATLGERVVERTHASGATVAYCRKPGYLRRYACFSTRFGSVDDRYRINGGPEVLLPDGVAHFLEHKMFEGPEEDAFVQFSRMGASANAFTSFVGTTYLFSCVDGFFPCLDHLVRFVQQPHFTTENVEKEKGIIGQEIRMYADNPGWRVYFNLLAGLYKNHPVAKDIAGTEQTIAGITPQILDQCWSTFYHPSNMILLAVADEDQESFFEAAGRLLSEQDLGPAPAVEKILTEEPAAPAREQVRQQMQVGRSKVLLGWKDLHPGISGRDLMRKELVTEVMLECIFGQSGPLFEELYRKDLIDDSFATSCQIHSDVGHSATGGDSADPDRLIDVIREEVGKIRKVGIDPADIERQRRSATGYLLRAFNSLDHIAGSYCGTRFLDGDPFEVVDLLAEITTKEVEERLQEHLIPDQMSSSIVTS
ncbi:MAG: insulinase family protein [Planctomycetes bacterium]|nr:insulinase family protein [Planctomycetota bacterium]MBT6453004.1 insulinase family protein [Planctomycetota bacterium]MBT6541843.1 insulinase family protein [Planctomycetota bacterium]MBT6783508.1 insulinase family protein [Planctomycetota bacterium]MBT6968836.1 insulinase family protein [Planctomycetota bacterium]